MSHKQQYDSMDVDYGSSTGNFHSVERFENAQKRRPQMGRKRGKAPQSFNGIHRRRRRKMAW